MNVKLLRKVAKHILAEPKRLDMTDWGYLDSTSRLAPACGTVCCIAGWAAVLHNPDRAKMEFENLIWQADEPGTNGLQLTPEESDRLFHIQGWPSDFRAAYWNQPRGSRAEITVARIEHFIKTKGRE
jgi:hypothetical protein